MKSKTKWSIDPAHSEVAFKIKNLLISDVKGIFRKFKIDIYTSGNDFTTAAIDVRIDPSSIDTGDAKRNSHLKGADFLNVSMSKEISFFTDTISKGDNKGNHEVWGKLNIKGISKLIKLNVLFGGIIYYPWTNERASFTVTGTIHRRDWNLNWNAALDTGGIILGEDIKITCEIQLIKSTVEDVAMILETVGEKNSMMHANLW